MSKYLELYSPFPPGECAKRLSSAIDPAALSPPPKSQSRVAGLINGASLILAKRTIYRYPDKPVFTGDMQPRGAGTTIRGKFAAHIINRVVTIVCYTLWCLFLVLAMALALSRASQFGLTAMLFDFLKGPAWIILLGAALEILGHYLARNEIGFLTDFLRQTLDASEVKPNENALQPKFQPQP